MRASLIFIFLALLLIGSATPALAQPGVGIPDPGIRTSVGTETGPTVDRGLGPGVMPDPLPEPTHDRSALPEPLPLPDPELNRGALPEPLPLPNPDQHAVIPIPLPGPEHQAQAGQVH